MKYAVKDSRGLVVAQFRFIDSAELFVAAEKAATGDVLHIFDI